MTIEELKVAWDDAESALQAARERTKVAFEESHKAWVAWEAKYQEEIGLRARLLSARTNFSTPDRQRVIKGLEHQIHRLKGELRELEIARERAGDHAITERDYNEPSFVKDARSAYNRYYDALNGVGDES